MSLHLHLLGDWTKFDTFLYSNILLKRKYAEWRKTFISVSGGGCSAPPILSWKSFRNYRDFLPILGPDLALFRKCGSASDTLTTLFLF